MNYYPINLNLANKKCIIIGGGRVAERKVFNLLEYGADIKLVSNEITEKIAKIQEKITLIKDNYNKRYLEKSALVFICTNNKDINIEIYKDAKSMGCLVNIATSPELCDFTIPSVVKRGDLQIAISTNGKSPAIAKIVKEKIDSFIEKEYQELVQLMGKIREKQLTINKSSDINKKLFYQFLDNNILEYLKNKNFAKINEKVKEIFGFDIEKGD